MRRDADRLVDIAEAARAIGQFIVDLNGSSFEENDLVRSDVFAKLIIIGEAARNLSQSFIERHVHIPWAQIVSTRNRIAHGYDQIDWEIVWYIASDDVPKLLANIESLLANPPR